MSKHIVHTYPGQSAAALTAGLLGTWDSNNKIALPSAAGAKVFGVISRTVSAASEATGLEFGICEVTAGEAIAAGDRISALATGKAQVANAGDYVCGHALTAASGADVTFLAVIFEASKQQDYTKVASLALDGATIHAAAGGVIAWQNPESSSIIITRAILDITTKATDGVATLDVGTTAVSAATTSDNLIDGQDVGAATGTFDNITEKGTNGKSRQKLAAGKWVTVDEKTNDATGLVGTLYIHYFVL